MLWSRVSPAQRTLRLATTPDRLMTATSAVPPPMSTIMLPTGSVVGSPAPMAAAMGSSMTVTCRAPALAAACRTARRSTSVTPLGTQMTTRGWANQLPAQACRIKLCSMAAVMSKSAMTPSFRGRTATMEPGARPMTALASWPTLRTRSSSVLVSTATTLGSRMMMPLPFMYTSVLAVPRSMPMSFVNIPRRLPQKPRKKSRNFVHKSAIACSFRRDCPPGRVSPQRCGAAAPFGVPADP